MQGLFVAWLVILLHLAGALAFGSAPAYAPTTGPFAVDVSREAWTDAARGGREIPVKMYAPRVPGHRCPLVVFSHGLGGGRENYASLGERWASHGYVVIHVQHHGTDSEIWKGLPVDQQVANLREAAFNPRNLVQNVRDIRFVLDEVLRRVQTSAAPGPLVDQAAIGIAGHSFGAATTLGVAGQLLPVASGSYSDLRDDRVKAIVAMSAPVFQPDGPLDRIYGGIRVPCLHLTGTADESPAGETHAAQRRIPYDHMAGVEECLINFIGGDHMIFSRRFPGHPFFGGTTPGASDALFMDRILQSSTAWWDFHLAHRPDAGAWLREGGLSRALASCATLESHPAR